MTRHRLPKLSAPTVIDIDEVSDLAERLNSLVVAECDLLSQMRIRDLAPFQDEKRSLSEAFDAYQRAIASDSQIVASASTQSRDRLYNAAAQLAVNIEENMRLTAIAQQVNRDVMKIFVEVISAQQGVSVYGKEGGHEGPTDVTVSLNINERA